MLSESLRLCYSRIRAVFVPEALRKISSHDFASPSTRPTAHNDLMLRNGVYPAAVTPFGESGRVDIASFARLLAWFEAAGCQGAVLAGTNGEGPSLSAVEKRDLLRQAVPFKGELDLILGIATTSCDDAEWLCKQAGRDGASAVLLMAPFYFREAGEKGVAAWFELVMSRSPLPVIVYNFPQRTGFTITPELLARLSRHERYLGAKDSSGEVSNLAAYRQATGDRLLFAGNETLLIQALESEWSGSISGAANAVPNWLCQIVLEWFQGDKESAETKFQIILPVIERLRQSPQPALNKALLHRYGVLASPEPRLPLEAVSEAESCAAADLIRQILGS